MKDYNCYDCVSVQCWEENGQRFIDCKKGILLEMDSEDAIYNCPAFELSPISEAIEEVVKDGSEIY